MPCFVKSFLQLFFIYNEIEIADHAIKLPLQDGYYFTFAFPPSMREIKGRELNENNLAYFVNASCYSTLFPWNLEDFDSSQNDPYKVKIYDSTDHLIVTLDYHYALPLNIKICKTKGNNFLFFPYAEKQQYHDSYSGGLFFINSNGDIFELKSQYMSETAYIKNNAEEYHIKHLILD